MTEHPHISIVVPCFRDERGLPALFARLEPVMTELGDAELVVVDDGSPDLTAASAKRLAANYPHPARVVRLGRNFGQHPAVFAGFEHSRGQIVVTMDSDLQYPPEDIPRLVAGIGHDWPVVSGYRENRRDPRARKVITRLLSWWLSRQTGSPLKDYGSMFRAYDREVVDQLLRFGERRRYVPALVAWLGVPVREIAVCHEARGEQGSRYRLAPLLDMWLDLITGYATFPLRVLTVVGLLTAVVGFIGSISFLVYRLVVGAGVSGYVSAFALVFFVLGVQTVLIAMLGEYIGRIYIEAKGRPYYVIAEVFSNAWVDASL